MMLQGGVSLLPVQGSPFGNLKTVHKHKRRRPRRPKGRAPIFFESFWFVCLVSEHDDAKEMKKLFPRITENKQLDTDRLFKHWKTSSTGRQIHSRDGDFRLNFFARTETNSTSKFRHLLEKRQHEKLISKLFFFPMTNGHESLLILVLLFLTAVPGFVSCRCSHLAASPRLKRQVWELNRLNRSGKIKRSSN